MMMNEKAKKEVHRRMKDYVQENEKHPQRR
jgi:hypothetical protein